MDATTIKGVLMLVNDFPPLPSGGAERQAERLASYMAKRQLFVGILTRHGGDLPQTETRSGFTIFRLPQFGFSKIKSVVFTLFAIFKLFSLRHQYDILHAHLAFAPALAGAFAGRLLGKRVIVKFGNSHTFGDVKRSQETMRGHIRLAILKRWVDMIVTLDPEMEKETLEAGFAQERVTRIDNGINTTDFAPALNKLDAKSALHLDGKIVLLFTGRLAPQKALPVLLQAMQKARKDAPNLHLLLVGEGEEEQNLRLLVKEFSIQEHVTFVGNVNSIQPYLHAADIFVLPSLGEGISNSLLEAMACGLACIATPVGGSQEVLGHGKYGVLVPTSNVDELANSITRLVSNPEERMRLGKEARAQIMNRYDMEAVGNKYFELYQQLMESKI